MGAISCVCCHEAVEPGRISTTMPGHGLGTGSSSSEVFVCCAQHLCSLDPASDLYLSEMGGLVMPHAPCRLCQCIPNPQPPLRRTGPWRNIEVCLRAFVASSVCCGKACDGREPPFLCRFSSQENRLDVQESLREALHLMDWHWWMPRAGRTHTRVPAPAQAGTVQALMGRSSG